jgi:gliding motility-associated lipoprotein GldD
VYGVIYDFQGSTASNMQFYLTDSTSHFVRGALYFEVTPKADSIAPAEKYIEEEIQHLIRTFTWTQ